MPSVSSSLGLDRALWAPRLSLNEKRLIAYVRRHVRAGRMWPRFAEPWDLVQETLLEAWRSRETFGGEEADVFRWLIGIFHHVVSDLVRPLRSKKRGFARVVRLEGNESTIRDPYSREPAAERILDEEEVTAFVREVLKCLSDLEYRVVILVLLRQISLRRTAHLLGEPLSRVEWILRRARRKLERELRRHAIIDRRDA